MAINALMPVEFAGATLYVINQEGQPFTPMKPIVEGMGLAWQPQHAKLKANATRWGIKEILIPSTITEIVTVETVGEIATVEGIGEIAIPSKDGKTRSMSCLPLRKLAGWLSTVSPNKTKPELRERIVRYQNECDDVLWDYWNKATAQPLPESSLASYSAHPGQTLSEDQAQTLRAMLDEFVKTLPKEKQGGFMMKGWAKLKAHFNVGYREIPAEKFTDAVSIIARHIVEYSTPALAAPAQAELNLQPGIDMERIRQTMIAANEVAAKVQAVVFFEMLNGKKNWQNERWCLSFVVDGRNDTAPPTPTAWQTESDAFIGPLLKLAQEIGKEGGILLATIQDLLALNSASSQALSRRLAA